MDLINCFGRLWHARQLAVSAGESPVKTEGADRMLQGLQQLCAILPQGEAEVWLSNGQINLSLHWNPEVKTQGCKGATMPGNAEEKLRGKSQEIEYNRLYFKTVNFFRLRQCCYSLQGVGYIWLQQTRKGVEQDKNNDNLSITHTVEFDAMLGLLIFNHIFFLL